MDALPGARLVGGCVRDTLAARPIADIDIATPHPPDDAARRLRAAGLRVIPTGIAHGTVTAVSHGQTFEITTLRRDEETDGRHARVVWTDSFEEDAARRDFTINAMSVDAAGKLHDYFCGQADLQAGRIRFVGDARLRVAEDYLRILRFFRFHARYGRGAPDPNAAAAIRAATPGLAQLSAERVWSECKAILATPDPSAAVALMHQLGVLDAVLPDAANHIRLRRLVQAGAPPDPILRLAALLTGTPDDLADRLKLSGAERSLLSAYAGGAPFSQNPTDAALRRALADEPAPVLIGRSWLADTDGAAIRHRLAELPVPIFPLEGRHALALGAIPGPRIGEMLRQTRAWWLDGGCMADEAACLEQLALQMKT